MVDPEMYIEINPQIMMGKPVIKGTRITVELIIEKLAAGETMEGILGSYPSLTRTTILTALQFAADHLNNHWALSCSKIKAQN